MTLNVLVILFVMEHVIFLMNSLRICFKGVPNDNWRVSKLNEKYDVIDTYPSYVSNQAIWGVCMLTIKHWMKWYSYKIAIQIYV